MKRFYIIGIAGVAMGNLAVLLKQKGYEVAGSDQEVYEPMNGLLQKEKIKIFTPYRAINIKKWKPDIVVVGNVISRGNLELEFVMDNGHSYRSVSDMLMEEFIEGKKPIVITGTHGKTTTAALVAWILECAGFDPTVFVGGFTGNFSGGAKLGRGQFIVLEGDEYDTSFFDKNPKFLHYRTYIGLLNNIELDHVDIYQNIAALKIAFRNFIKLIPKSGFLVINAENKNVRDIVRNAASSGLWKNNSTPSIITFGIKTGDYHASNVSRETRQMAFDVFHEKHPIIRVKTTLSGKHNISNILGAVAIAKSIGVSHETIHKAISSFLGVKRRMEVLGEKNGVIVIDDYAHHPTAVSATIMATREKFHSPVGRYRSQQRRAMPTAKQFGRQASVKQQRIIAIFEPGSASSRRNIFEKEYVDSLNKADIALIYKPFKAGQIKRGESFKGKHVSREINRLGGNSLFFDNLEKLMFHVKTIAQPGDILLIMSCRGFDGLREKIMEIL